MFNTVRLSTAFAYNDNTHTITSSFPVVVFDESKAYKPLAHCDRVWVVIVVSL